MTTPSLFRQDAVEHAGVRSYGQVVLLRPLSFTFLTGMFLVMSAGLLAFLFRFEYSSKIQIQGIVAPTKGVVRVVPTMGGTVATCLVLEGQEVKAGDVLFVLRNESTSATRGETQKIVSSLLGMRRDSLAEDQTQLRKQLNNRVDALHQRVIDFQGALSQIEEQISLQRRRVSLAEDALNRYRTLATQGFVSAAQTQDRQSDLLDQRQRLADLERTKAATSRDLVATRTESVDIQTQAYRDRSAVQRNVAVIEQDLTENEGRRETFVRAPLAGVVRTVTAEPGQFVSTTQAIASIIPIGSNMEVVLYAPSRAIGLLAIGAEVTLRFQAFPYQRFGQQRGLVSEVASTAMRVEELTAMTSPVAGASSSEPVYRIRVKLDRQSVTAYGVDRPLKAGMAVEASIALERRYLYQWALEPLYSIAGHL